MVHTSLLNRVKTCAAEQPQHISQTVRIALVSAFLVRSHGSVTSSSVTNLAKAAAAPQQDTVGHIGAPKVAVVEKKGDVKGASKEADEKKVSEPREEVDGAKSMKTSHSSQTYRSPYHQKAFRKEDSA